jgi:hypothetical protein
MATDICETDPDDDSEPPKVVSDPRIAEFLRKHRAIIAARRAEKALKEKEQEQQQEDETP